MTDLLKEFLQEHQFSDNLKFDTCQYRKGAPITSSFGLEKRFRLDNGKMIWDSVSIHNGVDRSVGRENVVIAPFNFDKTEYHDYGKAHVYGSVTRLFSTKYGFELRIMHMSQDDLNPDVIELLKAKQPIKQNTIIGRAGTYGLSTGNHTHTELISMTDERSPLLDEIGNTRFQDWEAPLNDKEVEEFYRQTDRYKSMNSTEIMKAYDTIVFDRKILAGRINKYWHECREWYYGWDIRTRYSTEFVFNRL